MATVHVSGISSSTTDAQLHDFFSFCGKITSVEHKGSEATIHFDKASAAHTATMLHEGQLDGATLTVTADVAHSNEHPTPQSGEDHGIDQSDKPRAGIAAEYLAKGYILSEKALGHAIEIDKKQGISQRFLNYLSHFNNTLGEKAFGKPVTTKAQETVDTATARAKEVDQQKGYSKIANDYYSKALSSSYGEKVLAFYTTTAKQVQDIHEEAKRLKEAHKAQEAGHATAAPAAESSAVPQDVKTQAAPTAA